MRVSAFVVPTDSPESDGTLEWDRTTVVVVEVSAGDCTGLGYTYADVSTAHFIEEVLGKTILGRDAMEIPSAWNAMGIAVRNHGRPGVAAMAMAAVDGALWDLKARLLKIPWQSCWERLVMPWRVYGSGGFTSYSDAHLGRQLEGWVADGITEVKVKVGREPERDAHRVRIAREAIGPAVRLYADANGAYRCKQALGMAERFNECDVTWFEEPVSSDDLAGLHLIRGRVSAGMDIAAGEYGYRLGYFRQMLEAEAGMFCRLMPLVAE